MLGSGALDDRLPPFVLLLFGIINDEFAGSIGTKGFARVGVVGVSRIGAEIGSFGVVAVGLNTK